MHKSFEVIVMSVGWPRKNFSKRGLVDCQVKLSYLYVFSAENLKENNNYKKINLKLVPNRSTERKINNDYRQYEYAEWNYAVC